MQVTSLRDNRVFYRIPQHKLKPVLTHTGFGKTGILNSSVVGGAAGLQASMFVAGGVAIANPALLEISSTIFMLGFPAGVLIGTSLYLFAHFSMKLSRLFQFDSDCNLLFRALNSEKDLGKKQTQRMLNILSRIHVPSLIKGLSEKLSLSCLDAVTQSNKFFSNEYAPFHQALVQRTGDVEILKDYLLNNSTPLDIATLAALNPACDPDDIAALLLDLKLSEDEINLKAIFEVFGALSDEKKRPVLGWLKIHHKALAQELVSR
jgi:hypothetical protein